MIVQQLSQFPDFILFIVCSPRNVFAGIETSPRLINETSDSYHTQPVRLCIEIYNFIVALE